MPTIWEEVCLAFHLLPKLLFPQCAVASWSFPIYCSQMVFSMSSFFWWIPFLPCTPFLELDLNSSRFFLLYNPWERTPSPYPCRGWKNNCFLNVVRYSLCPATDHIKPSETWISLWSKIGPHSRSKLKLSIWLHTWKQSS